MLAIPSDEATQIILAKSSTTRNVTVRSSTCTFSSLIGGIHFTWILTTMAPKKGNSAAKNDSKKKNQKKDEEDEDDKGGKVRWNLGYAMWYSFELQGKLKAATAVNVRHILCEKHSRAAEALALIQVRA